MARRGNTPLWMAGRFHKDVTRVVSGQESFYAAEALREPCSQVAPAIETDRLVDAVPLNLGFVGHDLLRRTRRVLDLKDDSVVGPVVREGFAAEWTGIHFRDVRVIRT